METMRRIFAMVRHSVRIRSVAELLLLVGVPVLVSLMTTIIASTPSPESGSFVVMESPRGVQGPSSFPRIRLAFGIFIVLVMTTMITRAGAIHKERQEGRVQRTLVCGVSYSEIVIAHVIGIFLAGAAQIAIFLAVTGLLGVPWLEAGWPVLIAACLGALVAVSGLAVAVSGITRNDGQVQFVAGGAPSLLAMLGGVFFPLEIAPATMQRLAVINPFHWVMESLGAGYVYTGLSSQAIPLAILMLVGAVGLVIGVQGLRRIEP